MSLVIKSHLPSSAIVPPMSSSSKHVIQNRMVEIPANISGSYSFTGNSRIEFDINSASDFIDFTKSYVRFNLASTLSFEGQNDLSRYLAEGGAHSLFRTVEITTSSGVRISRLENYGRWYAMMSSVLAPRLYVDQALHREADGSDGYSQTEGYVSPNGYAVTGTAFAWDASTLLLTGTGSTFLKDLRVKDIVVIEDVNLESHVGVVESVLTNTTATVTFSKADDIAGNILRVLKPQAQSTRNRMAVNSSTVSFQPAVPFLQQDSWFPLMLVRGGLRVSMDLERPEYVLSSPHSVISAGMTNAGVTISNCYYVCNMITPDQSLSQSYLNMFKNSGISYSFLNYNHQMDVISAGSSGRQNIQMNAGVRSARHLLCKIQNIRAQTVTGGAVNGGKSTFTADSIAQGLKANLAEFQVESGSDRFPLSSPLDCTSVDNAELYASLQNVFDVMGSSLSQPRFLPEQWAEVASNVEPFEQGVVPTGRVDSDRLVIGVNLARDSSPFSGLDLSLNSLNIQPNFDASYTLVDDDGTTPVSSPLYWLSYLGYDATLNLSANGGIKVFS